MGSVFCGLGQGGGGVEWPRRLNKIENASCATRTHARTHTHLHESREGTGCCGRYCPPVVSERNKMRVLRHIQMKKAREKFRKRLGSRDSSHSTCILHEPHAATHCCCGLVSAKASIFTSANADDFALDSAMRVVITPALSAPRSSSRVQGLSGLLRKFGVRCVVCGVWCVVCGVWCVVCGVWCVVYGVWCVVCGVWCVVCGVWCMVYGVICSELWNTQLPDVSRGIWPPLLAAVLLVAPDLC